MAKISELIAYLECENNKLNDEFPKYEEITTLLFQKVYDFFDTDFEELTDNRVYRCFITSFKEMICFAFEKDVSKAYLRYFFKILNNQLFVGYLVHYAKSREKDIRFTMVCFLDFFVATWQGCDNNKERVLEHIVGFIDSRM